MPTARLLFTASIEEQWQTVTGPWLKQRGADAWKSPKPTVVLTPSRAESFYLRSRLVEQGITYFGLRFWTPSDARQFLLGEPALKIQTATQAELRLVARVAAEYLLKKKNPADESTLKSVVQEPGPFLRAYDLLLGAGWNPAQKGAAYGRGLAREMERQLKEREIATQAGIHRLLLQQIAASKGAPLLANLLIVGFNASHWPLWDLLRAVVFTATDSTVALSNPRVFGEATDQLWISSWEESLGVSAEVPATTSQAIHESPFLNLIESYEQGTPGNSSTTDLTFLVAPDLHSQAQAVVLQAVDYLKCEDCSRLGIIFPEANALALEVANQLGKQGILLNDGTGSIQPGIFEQSAWTTWIALQEEASVSRLTAWLRACEVEGRSWGLEELTAREVVHVIDKALGETLVDDLDFLARYLSDSNHSKATTIADFLRQRVVLPENASFTDFLALTRQALAGPGWDAHREKLKIDPPSWLMKDDDQLSRRTFLGWLRESTDSRQKTRAADGNHFYGKVHLLIYAQMTGQTWTHLILTGLNEGVWPRVFEAETFGSRHELAALNQQARELNRAGTVQGGQGAGHETVRADHGHCLLPLERLDLSLRDLCAALEGTSQSICLAAASTEAGRTLLPSDFFNHAYHAKTGRILDEEDFRALAQRTSDWCERHDSLLSAPTEDTQADIALTKIAYDARRNPAQAFGPYEFAYASPPAEPIQLSCKTWEDAWNHPATVWLEKVVGVSRWPDGTLSWPRAVGTWVHRWLTLALRECQEKNSIEGLLPSLRKASEGEAARTRARAKAVNLELYPWWEQVWGQAESITRGLGESLIPVLQDKQFLSEYSLPGHLQVALPGAIQPDFALSGRIDLLVVEPGSKPCDSTLDDFSGATCWVIDFKTGSAQSLNAKKVGKGIGLQTILYALAVRTQGAAATSISLHTFDAPLKPQVQLDDALEMKPLFQSLETFHRAGIFGLRGDAQNDYGFSPSYPMATRFVSSSILETKWSLLHGTAAGTEEEAE